MTGKQDGPLIVSLDDFAEQVAAERTRCYCDTLPAEIQDQLINADVSTAVASAWLERIGFESTGLESWRRKKRAERGRHS